MKLHFLFSLIATTALASEPIWVIPRPTKETKAAETPLLTHRQDYLGASPLGVGAIDAWNIPGGRGENVRFVDIETGIHELHEDFPAFQSSGPIPMPASHGTAVAGIMVGRDNPFGIVGIAHQGSFGFFGFIEGNLDEVNEAYITGINNSIRGAVSTMQAGDVLVIEQHMLGPDAGRYTAVEYWQEIFNELKAATDKGIHCLEAAGNGGSNFDAPAYAGAFDVALRDSGCVLVGAGNRQKEKYGFSNYGTRVDTFGYGGNVVSTGMGDLFNGGTNRTYTAYFSGTSSATPIVAGVVGVVSSIAKAQGKTISPQQMREALRATGVPQGPLTKDQRIGNFPNIAELLKYLKLVEEDSDR